LSYEDVESHWLLKLDSRIQNEVILVPFETIHGKKIYYEVHGSGDTVVLLHHGFGCTRMWKEIYPSLLKAGYRVLMYDRRGYGQSEKGDDFQEFYESDRFRPESVRELAVLRDKLGLDSFHIIGQCEGGVVGVDFAGSYPHCVKTLFISSTQCYSEITMAEFNSIYFPQPFLELKPELREKFIEWHGANHAETSYNQFRKYGGAYGRNIFDLRPLLPRVSCPALVLYPDRSALFAVEQAIAFYRHLPKGELAVLPGCGHNTYEQRPKEYTRLALDFLRRHPE
jgi:pimeloyl-ACP methyl ester carboxylesterase